MNLLYIQIFLAWRICTSPPGNYVNNSCVIFVATNLSQMNVFRNRQFVNAFVRLNNKSIRVSLKKCIKRYYYHMKCIYNEVAIRLTDHRINIIYLSLKNSVVCTFIFLLHTSILYFIYYCYIFIRIVRKLHQST